ncbi:hypothetical protein TNIN_439441 [Trichonephila inaurata madagascariensis]|uniref:Uncharacterized protein n=1 Tax=Trichonephila inaurata madagascariensis TaxID=2747483 RepID=A0A8X6YFL4_9ARAC|nr:hypothetical protein TNIN_439441 [Trichonephila inaurata madagascariensis]
MPLTNFLHLAGLKTENIKPFSAPQTLPKGKRYLQRESLRNAGLVWIGGGKVPVQSRYRQIVLLMHDIEQGDDLPSSGMRVAEELGIFFSEDVVRFRMDGCSGGRGRFWRLISDRRETSSGEVGIEI